MYPPTMTDNELRYELDEAIKVLQAFDVLRAWGSMTGLLQMESTQELWRRELDAEIEKRKVEYARSRIWRETIHDFTQRALAMPLS
jgi:hypothetical protein